MILWKYNLPILRKWLNWEIRISVPEIERGKIENDLNIK
jgi:hypothetical protein